MSTTSCIFCGHERSEHGSPCGHQDIDISRFPPRLREPCPCEKIGIIKFPEGVDGQPYWRARKQLTCQEWWDQRHRDPAKNFPIPREYPAEGFFRRYLLKEFSLTCRGFMTTSPTNHLWQDHVRSEQRRTPTKGIPCYP